MCAELVPYKHSAIEGDKHTRLRQTYTYMGYRATTGGQSAIIQSGAKLELMVLQSGQIQTRATHINVKKPQKMKISCQGTFKPKWGSTLNKLQQKQTQLILCPQYVLSKEIKNPRRIPLGERLEKQQQIYPIHSPIHSFSHVKRVKILTFR